MKTMIGLDGIQIVRVSDEKASRLFNEGYKYIAKSIWKEKVRDVEKETTSDDGYISATNKKSNKMSKAQKRHSKKVQ